MSCWLVEYIENIRENIRVECTLNTITVYNFPLENKNHFQLIKATHSYF